MQQSAGGWHNFLCLYHFPGGQLHFMDMARKKGPLRVSRRGLAWGGEYKIPNSSLWQVYQSQSSKSKSLNIFAIVFSTNLKNLNCNLIIHFELVAHWKSVGCLRCPLRPTRQWLAGGFCPIYPLEWYLCVTILNGNGRKIEILCPGGPVSRTSSATLWPASCPVTSGFFLSILNNPCLAQSGWLLKHVCYIFVFSTTSLKY